LPGEKDGETIPVIVGYNQKDMATGTTRKIRARRNGLPHGAWSSTDATWGEKQRVRLITGSPSLAESEEHIRSIHAVGFTDPERVLLVENKDRTWTFPGGRLEGGETLDEALRREVWEEARAVLAPIHRMVAVTRIEFLNRVPGRVYRVHPSYIAWVAAQVSELSDEPHNDPADGVIGRRIVTLSEAQGLLGPLECRVLEVAIACRREVDCG
jgi:8-oxo-dGTP pyrophosphatase MutT (NUDIX family)